MDADERKRRPTASTGVFGVFDEVFNPAAARARAELAAQHELVQEVPSPGDLMLRRGELEITLEVPPSA